MIATAEQRLAYEQSADTADASTRCLLAAFAYLGIPKRLADVGCGDGHLVMMAGKLGVFGTGYDIGLPCNTSFARVDLRKVDLAKPMSSCAQPVYDLVLCWEVAEHLPAEAAETLCNTVVGLMEPCAVLLWTAAIPGQGGAGHINEQLPSYWADKLQARGLVVDTEATSALRAIWKRVALNAWWYEQNLILLRRRPRDD